MRRRWNRDALRSKTVWWRSAVLTTFYCKPTGPMQNSAMSFAQLLNPSTIFRLLSLPFKNSALHVGAAAVLPVILSLNELCTNAVKYGALAIPSGRVAITLAADEQSQRFKMTWTETGGPTVAQPSRLKLWHAPHQPACRAATRQCAIEVQASRDRLRTRSTFDCVECTRRLKGARLLEAVTRCPAMVHLPPAGLASLPRSGLVQYNVLRRRIFSRRKSARLPLRVIRVGRPLSACPLVLQLQTYRIIAAMSAMGQ